MVFENCRLLNQQRLRLQPSTNVRGCASDSLEPLRTAER
jgi:hypothetical protein